MASYTTRQIHSVRHEIEIPTNGLWGADSAEIGKAWTAAQHAYCKANGLAVDTQLPDDALRWFPSDEGIVIAFIVEKPEQPEEPTK